MKNCLSILWWPLLFTLCLGLTGMAIAHGHGVLGFNVIYLGLALSLALLERAFPHELAWRKADGQTRVDLAHTLLNKGVVQVIVVVSTITGVAASVGQSSLKLWPATWPMAFQVVLGLVVLEFGLYWKHRLSHETRFLWPFHAVHHSASRLWFFNTGRFHFVDTAMSILFSLPLLFLLGTPDIVFSWIAAITAYIGILTHCNVSMRCPGLRLVFNTPDLHRWHHSRDLSEGNKNYGENLMLFDHLFGSYFYENRRPPADIGIDAPMPPGFFAQVAAPFGFYRRLGL